jgi:hypothetical protein
MEHSRAGGGSAFMRLFADLRRDIQHALRGFRRSPVYIGTSVLCLALGIGVNAAVFSFINSIYFRKLPVPQPERVLAIDRSGAMACNWGDYLQVRDDIRTLSGVAAFVPKGTFLDYGGASDRIFIEAVSSNYAAVLRVDPVRGRWFLREEESPTSEPVCQPVL